MSSGLAQWRVAMITRRQLLDLAKRLRTLRDFLGWADSSEATEADAYVIVIDRFIADLPKLVEAEHLRRIDNAT